MASIVKREGRPLPYFVFWREPGSKAQRAKAFARKKEAEAFRDTVSTDLRHGTYTDPRPIAFKVFAEDWLIRTKPAVSANTGALYEWAVNKYLIPAFGLLPIQTLTAERIERWQAELLGLASKVETDLASIRATEKAERASLTVETEQGILTKDEAKNRATSLAMWEKTAEAEILARGKPGPRSVEVCRTVLGTMLKDARMKGRLYANPMEAVRRFDVPKRELHYLTSAQVKELCEQVGRVYGVLFLVMAFCGLRIGEALGLEWPDVDLHRQRLLIQRQVIWRRKRDCPPGEPRWSLVEPKSKAGTRVVEIPGPLAPFLVAHREEQNGSPNPLALVFPSDDGMPRYPGTIRRQHFKPALKAIGLAGIRPHDFRRTFIAMHVEAGTHPKLVQERVGHSNIGLTMDVYGKLAGKMALGADQAARFDAMATDALPVLVNRWSTGDSKTARNGQVQPERRKAISA